MVIGAILQCAAFGLPQFIVGRLVTGYVEALNGTWTGADAGKVLVMDSTHPLSPLGNRNVQSRIGEVSSS